MGAFLKIGYNQIPRLCTNITAKTYRDAVVSELPSFANMKGVYYPNYSATIDAFQRISQLTDQSGNANNAVQAVDALKPLLSRTDNQENIFIYSETLENGAWSHAGTTSSANTSINPIDGALTADSLMETATTDFQLMYQQPRVIAGQQYRVSAYVKIRDTRTRCHLFAQNQAVMAIFDLTAGTVVSNTLCVGTIEASNDGFYRISILYTAPVSGVFPCGVGIVTGTNTTNYLGDITKGLYFYGLQFQISSASNTYIATTSFPWHVGINGEAVAIFDGSDDVLTMNSLAGTFTGEDKAITIFAVVADMLGTAAARSIAGFGNSGSASPYIDLRGVATTPATDSTYTKRDSAASTNFSLTFPGNSQTFKVISIVDSGVSGKAYINGVQSGSTTVTDIATLGTLDRASIGALVKNATSQYWSGKIAFLAIANTAFSDSDRAAWESFLSYAFTNDATPVLTETVLVDGDALAVQNAFFAGSSIYWRNSTSNNVTQSVFDLTLPSNQAAQTVDYLAIRGLGMMLNAGSGYIDVKLEGSNNNFITKTTLLNANNLTSASLVGPYLEDYILTGALSAAYRYFRITIQTQNAILHRLRKIYFGKLFDFSGRSPYYPYTPGYGENGSPFTSDTGSQFKTSMGRRPRMLEFSWRGITDSDRVFYDKNIRKNLTDYPIFLYEPPESDHEPLNNDSLVFGWASSDVGTKDWKNNNQISLTFREDIAG